VTDRPDALAYLSATQLAARVRARELSPVDLVEHYLARIERFDRRLGAFVTVTADAAREAARRAEAEVVRGELRGPLHGVPFAVKDQFDTQGIRTTVGSRILDANVPAEDATVVARLKSAGAILLGKLNLSEFAFGGTVCFPFGQPRNPWHPDHQPGGSSGGSAVATAAALAAFTLGEDTGGSVRGPAAWCGCVGLRPTWGLVSRHGTFSVSWSMDTAGPLTRAVEDSALVLGVIAGYDPKDPLTSRRPLPDYRAAFGGDARGLRIGLILELVDGEGTHAEVRQAVRDAARTLEALGASVEDVSLPTSLVAGAVFMALCDSEGAARHQEWLRHRSADYDQGTRRRLLTASLLPAALYHQAQRARALIRQEILEAFQRYDLLVGPTRPTPAPAIGKEAEPVASAAGAARRFFGARADTTPFSLAGTPAISIPCGFSSAGLPIGLQLAGAPFTEPAIFRVAHAFERATAWHTRHPPL